MTNESANGSDMERKENSKMRVLMLPWLARGHIGPFLELAKHLIKRNMYIYFCSTSVNLDSIKDKISQNYSNSIQLVEIEIPTMPELPRHYHTTDSLPPRLVPTLRHALEMASPNVSKILDALTVDLAITDFILPWAASLVSSHDIPIVEFVTTGATMTSFLLHMLNDPSVNFPFEAINVSDNWFFNSRPNESDSKNWAEQVKNRPSRITLIKTFKEIEGKYIDYLSSITDKRTIPVGPLFQELNNEEGKSEIIEWLNKKERSSTIYVSFGTEKFLSIEEIQEISYGLELTSLNFILVIRFHMEDQTSIEEALPLGFLDRVGERAMVVKGWAPQGRILGNGSIGGFVTHCGWGSLMESIKYGVPIIAMPMDHDQPINAKLVEEIGVGFEVKRDMNWKIQRQEIAKVVKDVVVETKGECIRNKAKELSKIVGNKGEEEIDFLVEELIQLCCNGN